MQKNDIPVFICLNPVFCFFTHRLQVGHHIEDDEVVEEVEESGDGPLQGADEGGAGGPAQLSAGPAL